MEYQGAQGAMLAKSITFSVEKCQNSTKSNIKCATPESIEEYIKDLTVDYWSIENTIDLAKFRNEHIQRDQKILQQHLLGHNQMIQDTIRLEKVNYNIWESFFGSKKAQYEGQFYKVMNIVNRPIRDNHSKVLL